MYLGQNGKTFALLTGLAIATQVALPSGIAAPAATNVQAQVAQGKAELSKGKLDNAISILTKAAQAQGMKPGSCDTHYHLGMALCKKAKTLIASDPQTMADYRSAKKELRAAIRVGQGNAISKQANAFMMSNLPQAMLQPRAGEGTEMIAARLGLRSSDRGIGATPRPKVFEFYAEWCEPCKELKPIMAKMKQQYGDQIEITSINVDDQTNSEIVDQYDVSPIPTVIFLNPDGQVVGYSIGFSEKTVEKELQKILPQKTADKT
jgi:thiol-disulfide isomerase/thioredoxin